MNRQHYLADTQVQHFVAWLSAQLDTSLFAHAYTDRRSGVDWQCSSLYDAFAQYAWKHPANPRLGYPAGQCSASNGRALATLRHDLITGLGCDQRSLQATTDVMAWGGVMARNADWLKANQTGLGQMLQQVQAALDAGVLDDPLLRSAGLRFNAGMTKVYSLLCQDFVIYDSRVAAALGWIVCTYCLAHGLVTVPKALCFPWAAAKEALDTRSAKRRNPGRGTLRFQRLRGGAHHAAWNLKASWVLSAVLAHPHAQASQFQCVAAPNAPLRALEAALFMIGYDLGQADTEANLALAS